ncbi:glycosyltransferase family 2 protein [Halomarina salina]|uniref:Glycosyltransferase family 2 protein n=1 Tax=Halomarina salina TaxID=1872699 RepID=A0ABD5RH39_9EURY|nr:glycosyltransferase family A protein [Halomarina salina]
MSDEAAPVVSVVIPTYGRPERLRAAVESVRAQTYDAVELVVVDDCSPTPARETLADVPSAGLARLEILRHDENRGANAARNTGIEAATGEFVAFLDDDDRWREEKLAAQVHAFETGGDAVGAVCTGTEYDGPQGTVTKVPTADGDVAEDILMGAPFGEFSALMVRRSVVEQAGLPDTEFPSWQDKEWYIRLSLHCEFRSLPELLTLRDIEHADRISHDFETKRDVSYPLFLARHRDLARSYGRRCERRFLATLNTTLGRSAVRCERYADARTHFARALKWDPTLTECYPLFLASLGGRYSYELARGVARMQRERTRSTSG